MYVHTYIIITFPYICLLNRKYIIITFSLHPDIIPIFINRIFIAFLMFIIHNKIFYFYKTGVITKCLQILYVILKLKTI